MDKPRSQVTEGLADRMFAQSGWETMIATFEQTLSETKSRHGQPSTVRCLGNTRWGGGGLGGRMNQEAEDAAELSLGGRH